MGRLADIDAEMHELPDYEKGIQAERERIIGILMNTTTKFRIPLEAGELKRLWEDFLRQRIIDTIKDTND